MSKFFADLFKGPGNAGWELARFLAFWAVASYSGAFLVTLFRGGAPLDFSSIGTGYGIVLAGAGALIWAKDTARTAAVTAAHPPTPQPTVGPNETVIVTPPGDGR